MGGLFSSSNQRILSSDETRTMYSSEQQQHLQRVFNALKRNDYMSHAVFRRTFLPANSPTKLSQYLYEIYSIVHSSFEISYDDFAEINYLLQAPCPIGTPDKKAVLCFYFFKQHTVLDPKQAQGPKGELSDSFMPSIFVHVGTHYFQMQEHQVTTFLEANNIRMDREITLNAFLQLFDQNKNHILFKWYIDLTKDYTGLLNCQKDPHENAANYSRQMSATTRQEIAQQNRINPKQPIAAKPSQPEEGTSSVFNKKQTQILHDFFHKRLTLKVDLKESLKMLSDLFKDMKLPPLLERRIIESFLYANETNYFEWNSFLSIMCVLSQRAQDDEIVIGYIFDIFTKYQQVMLNEQLRQVCEIFVDTGTNKKLAEDFQRCESLSRVDFIQTFKNIGVSLHHFSKISTLFDIEFASLSPGQERELDVIRILLDGETDLKVHFQTSLARSQQDDSFYIIAKPFWQRWCSYVGLPRKDSFGVQLEKSESLKGQSERSRRPGSIQNESLRCSGSLPKLKPSLMYGKDFVIVPVRVWKAFTKWYGGTGEFMRKVVVYPVQELSLRAASQLQSLQSLKTQVNEQQIVQSLEQLVYKDEATEQVKELEVDELFIKCGRIKDDGKTPSAGSLRDGVFSRKTTVQYVMQQLVSAFENKQTQNEKDKPQRIWIVDQGPANQDMLNQSLEQAGVRSGDKVYIEFQLESRDWPSARELVDKSQTDAFRTKGCANLGNTCYMNSAMQCFAYSPYVREFFTGTSNSPEGANEEAASEESQKKDPPYKYQVNPNNVLGHQGDFVLPFADTLGKMWDSGAIFSVYPWGFKSALGKVNEQFQGRRQHDSHEFLLTLLDALHEELNVRQKKPAIENPDDRRDFKAVNDEFWANFLRRNWSFMVFIFYGQSKSLITCDVCENARVNYGVFSNLGLPIPNANTLILPVLIYQIPSELSSILRKHVNEMLQTLMDENPSFNPAGADQNLSLHRGLSQAIMDKADEFAIEQSKREKAILINIAIDQGQTVSHLLEKISQMRNISLVGSVRVGNTEIELTKSLVFVQKDAKKQATTLMFELKNSLEDIGVMDRQALVVTEVLTDYAKQVIQEYYVRETNKGEEPLAAQEAAKDTSLLRSQLDYSKFIDTESYQVTKERIKVSAQLFAEDPIANTSESQETLSSRTLANNLAGASEQSKPRAKQINPLQYFNIFYKNKVPPVELLPNYEPPEEIIIMVFNRKLCLRDTNERLVKKYEPVLFGMQFPILATANTTRRELYEQVWMRVRSQFKHTSYDRNNLWWNKNERLPKANSSDARQLSRQSYSPFVLKHVDIVGVSCSICHWSKRCLGCPIEPNTGSPASLKRELLRNTYIACEWDINFYEQNVDTQGSQWQEHESVGRMYNELEKPVPLTDCIELYSKSDSLNVNCTVCKQNQPSKKVNYVQQCPPVLILHLKRFKMTSYQVVKMQNMVTYPLYDLDMGEHIPFKDPNMCYLYDLYGVVNHFGTMTGGHYTATVKNERTQEWLYYDDSSVKTYAESDVVTRSAYILFYRRKDLTNKPMSAVVPRLNKTMFAGMPVQTKDGKNCYLIEYREGQDKPLVLGLGDSEVIHASLDEVEADPDSEDLSAFNNMFKAKKKDLVKNLEEQEKKQPAAAAAPRKENKPKDKERDCSIF